MFWVLWLEEGEDVPKGTWLWSSLGLWVGFPRAQSHSGVDWPAALARGNRFEMHPPSPTLKDQKCPHVKPFLKDQFQIVSNVAERI